MRTLSTQIAKRTNISSLSNQFKPSSANSFLSRMSSSTPTSATPSSSSLPSASQLSLKNVNIETAPGIELSQDQKTIVGSVLDLFQGHVSLKKLALWDENATFNDPLTTATGYKQFAAQWVRH